MLFGLAFEFLASFWGFTHNFSKWFGAMAAQPGGTTLDGETDPEGILVT
jgi:hypothetical protein